MRYTETEITEETTSFITETAYKYGFANDQDLVTDLYACLSEGSDELVSRQEVLVKYHTLGEWNTVYKFVNMLFFKYIAFGYDAENGLDHLLSYMRFLDPQTEKESKPSDPQEQGNLLEQIQKMLDVAQFFGGEGEAEEAAESATVAESFLSKGKDSETSTSEAAAMLAGAALSPATFTGSYPARVDAMRQFIAGLTTEEWKRLHIVDSLEDLIEDATHSENREKVKTPENHIDVHQAQGVEDVGKVIKSDMARYDTTEDLLIAINRKDVNKIQDEKLVQKKQLLYFLIDNSGSMRSGCCMVETDRFTSSANSGTIASCVAYAFLNKIRKEDGMFYLRFFGSFPSDIIVAEKPEDFRHVSRLLGIANYDDGGTNILSALDKAYLDIEKADAGDKLEKATVYLITDGGASCSALSDDFWQNRISKYGLHVAMVGGSKNPDLKSNATTYKEIKSLKKEDMKNLVKDFTGGSR